MNRQDTERTLESPSDTISVSMTHDEYSIGRFIPFTKTKSPANEFLFTIKESPADFFTDSMRARGEPAVADRLNTDFSFIVLSVSLLLAVLLSIFGKNGLTSYLTSLSFRSQTDDSARLTSSVMEWQMIIRNVFSVVTISLFAAAALLYSDVMRYDDPSGSVKLTSVIAGSFMAALMLRHLTCLIAGAITGQSSLFREYMSVIYNAWFACALILFLIDAILIFSPVSNTLPIIITGMAIIAIFLIIRILRLLVIFMNRHISIFYFILYLCALEILPVLVILKILGVF